jgi:pimeloyl-ACP methyl ester carboxylesterase
MSPSVIYHEVRNAKVRIMRAGAGEPLVFLHGAGGLSPWGPFLEELSTQFDVIAPEHPGFGDSGDGAFIRNVADMAMYYLDFLDSLHAGAVHLVGTSLGGWIAADLAVRDQSKLKTLSLVAPAGIHVNGVPKGDIFLWTPEQSVRNLFADQAMAEKVLAMQPDEDERRRKMKNALMLAKVGWQPRLYDPHLRKWLHRIAKPTLIVWGDGDKVIPPAYGPAYRDLIPGSKLEVLANCGHLPHIEKMAETAALIGKLIEGSK